MRKIVLVAVVQNTTCLAARRSPLTIDDAGSFVGHSRENGNPDSESDAGSEPSATASELNLLLLMLQ